MAAASGQSLSNAGASSRLNEVVLSGRMTTLLLAGKLLACLTRLPLAEHKPEQVTRLLLSSAVFPLGDSRELPKFRTRERDDNSLVPHACLPRNSSPLW